jgi:hypothetical protein
MILDLVLIFELMYLGVEVLELKGPLLLLDEELVKLLLPKLLGCLDQTFLG